MGIVRREVVELSGEVAGFGDEGLHEENKRKKKKAERENRVAERKRYP